MTGGAGAAILAALLIRRLDLRTGRTLLVTAAAAAGLLAATAASAAAALPGVQGPEAAGALGVVLAAASILSAVPQPLSLLRDRAPDLSGLSPLRRRLGAAAGAAWSGYGAVTGQSAVWLSASAALVSALIVRVVPALPAGSPAPAPASGFPLPAAVPAPAPAQAPASGFPLPAAVPAPAAGFPLPAAVPPRPAFCRGVTRPRAGGARRAPGRWPAAA